MTFIDLRPAYEQDPDYKKIQNYLNGGDVPVFNYHRFWAQSDVALAFATFAILFPQ
jgi:hypothetical protein